MAQSILARPGRRKNTMQPHVCMWGMRQHAVAEYQWRHAAWFSSMISMLHESGLGSEAKAAIGQGSVSLELSMHAGCLVCHYDPCKVALSCSLLSPRPQCRQPLTWLRSRSMPYWRLYK